MRRRRVLGVVGGAVLAALLGHAARRATSAERLLTVGYLANEPTLETSARLRAGLLARGWQEGRTLELLYRYTQDAFDIVGRQVAELVRLPASVIVAASPPAIRAAREATRRIPIVIATFDDPLAVGLVARLDRPGENLTGVTLAAPDLPARRLALLGELVPRADRVAVLYNGENRSNVAELRALEAAARRRRVELVPASMTSDGERRAALKAIERARVEALLVLADTLTVARRADLATFAARHRLPALYPLPEFVAAGGLAALGPGWATVFDDVAAQVDRILRGADPGALPIVRAEPIELHLSLKAARGLGLPIAPALLERAQRVVQ